MFASLLLVVIAAAPLSPQDAAQSAPPAPSDAATIPSVAPRELHVLLQLQYLSVVRDAQPSPAETGFILRRARVGAEGGVYSPRFAFRAELELAQGALTPLDVYGELKPTPRWSLRVGQVRVPFSRNWMISEERLAFADRSIATEEFRYDYDVGVLATARFLSEHLSTSLGVLNGAGRNVPANDNVDPLFVARVMGTLGQPWRAEEGEPTRSGSPSLTLGAAATLDYVPAPVAYGFASGSPVAPTAIVARDTNANGRPDGVRVLQLEGDLSFAWRGLSVDAEAYFRRESWGQIGALQPAASQFTPNSRFGGAFAQATYFILPWRLQAGARVATTEISPLALDGRKRPVVTCADAGGVPFACTLPFTDRRSELTLVAVGHWFAHGIQVTAMYSALRYHTDEQASLPWSREQRFLAQTQLAF